MVDLATDSTAVVVLAGSAIVVTALGSLDSDLEACGFLYDSILNCHKWYSLTLAGI